MSFGGDWERVFPAHAGVFPVKDAEQSVHCGIPRSRGGVSGKFYKLVPTITYSPLTRGCFPENRLSSLSRLVFPAHAGVFPPSEGHPEVFHSIPRSRGGVSRRGCWTPCRATYSPLTRGCFYVNAGITISGTVFPAHAGVFLGISEKLQRCQGIPCSRGGVSSIRFSRVCEPGYSPLTRGCFQSRPCSTSPPLVFPAHAGVFL